MINESQIPTEQKPNVSDFSMKLKGFITQEFENGQEGFCYPNYNLWHEAGYQDISSWPQDQIEELACELAQVGRRFEMEISPDFVINAISEMPVQFGYQRSSMRIMKEYDRDKIVRTIRRVISDLENRYKLPSYLV